MRWTGNLSSTGTIGFTETDFAGLNLEPFNVAERAALFGTFLETRFTTYR